MTFCGSLGTLMLALSSCLLLEGLQIPALTTLTPLLAQPDWLLYTYSTSYCVRQSGKSQLTSCSTDSIKHHVP